MKTHRALVRSSWLHVLLVSLVFSLGGRGPNKVEVSREPIVLAEGQGNPWISMSDGYAVKTRSVVGSKLDVAMFRSSELVPLSIAEGDWNQDGVTDLAAGYRVGNRGLLALRPGRFDRSAGHIPGESVLVYGLEDPPEYLAVGDFNADGNPDIVAASDGGTHLSVVAGNGTSSLRPTTYRPLSGQVTALHAADLGAPDGLPDIVVGVSSSAGYGIEILQSPKGAFGSESLNLQTAEPVTAIASGLTDIMKPRSLALAAGSSIHLVATAGTHVAITRLDDRIIRLEEPVTDVTIGNFTGSLDDDIAVLSTNGRLRVIDVDAGDELVLPYDFGSSSESTSLASLWVSSGGRKDLAILNRDRRTVTFLHERHLRSAVSTREAAVSESFLSPYPPPTPVEITTTRYPSALVPVRANRDAFDDLVILTGDGIEESKIAVAVSTPLSSIVVNDSGMDSDADPFDDQCRTQKGTCTYVAAVSLANRRPGHDEITFAVGQIITQSSTTSPILNDATTINGAQSDGSKLIVTGTGNALHFWEGASNSTVLNVISGGVFMTKSDNMVVQSNWIGITPAGDSLDNPQYGGLTLTDGTGAQVGGPNAGESNHLSYLRIQRFGEVIVEGNTIGTTEDGSELLLRPEGISANHGIMLREGSHAQIGGVDPGSGNLVHGGNIDGVSVAEAEHVLIQGNMIGTDVDGYVALSPDQTSEGVDLSKTSVVMIGGSVRGAGNLISGVEGEGIRVAGDSTTIQGNWIGTTSSGGGAIGNGANGIDIYGSCILTHIGGSETADQANVIVASEMHGIDVGAVIAESQTVIEGNYIGTSPNDPVDLGNGSNGINLFGSQNVRVGGHDPTQSNTVAYNDANGVSMYSDAFGNSILGNSIHSNTELGIGSWSPNPNDPGDSDTGPNGRQNFPELTVVDSGNLEVSLSSTPSRTFRIELFSNRECDPSGHGEGETPLEGFELTTGADGRASTRVNVTPNPGSEFITATATDPDGNTSEFSACASVPTIRAFVVKVMQDSLRHEAQPIPMVEFEFGTIDDEKVATILGVQASNPNGLIFLPESDFLPGEPFFVRAHKKDVEATRSNHGWVEDLLYRVTVDNLLIDRQGRITPDRLAANPEDTTVTYLGHTLIGFNLMVGVQWKAVDAYVESMELAFRDASNYLFDVTNGQAYLRQVTVFDDSEYWNSVDLQFEADNTSWPRASVNGILSDSEEHDEFRHIYMPPKFFGRTESTVNGSYTEYPLNLRTDRVAATLIHELGHYGFGLYDEYQDENDKKIYPNEDEENPQPNIIFGFMDWADPLGDMESEMSAFATDEYKETEQWHEHQKVAWDFFRDRYRDVGGPLRAEIHTPALLGMRHPAFCDGPYRFTDLNIGSELVFVDLTSSFEGPFREYKVIDAVSRKPEPGALVAVGSEWLEWMRLGKTVISAGEHQGKIRLRGAETGETIYLLQDEDGFEYKALAKVLDPSAGKVGDAEVVELPTIEFEGGLLALVSMSQGGSAILQIESPETSLQSSSVRVIPGTTGEVIPVTGGPADFSAQLPDDLPYSATLLLESTDATGTDFFVPLSLSIIEVDTVQTLVTPPGQALELKIRPESFGVELLTILSSPFIGPSEGLPDSVARVSDIFGIDWYPKEEPLAAVLSLYYDPDSLLAAEEGAVDIYRWDGDRWSAQETDVIFDTLMQVAATTIARDGYYAVYLDRTRTTAVGVEDDGLGLIKDSHDGILGRPYPNPFGREVTIPFTLTEAHHVIIEVFDVTGRRAAVLADGYLQPGEHLVSMPRRNLPAGVYFVRLESGGRLQTVPITILH